MSTSSSDASNPISHTRTLLISSPSRSDSSRTTSIQVYEPPSTSSLHPVETLGLHTWGAAWVLSNALSNIFERFLLPEWDQILKSTEAADREITSAQPQESLRVIELGAGTGVVGLTAAALLQRWRRDALTPSETGHVKTNVEVTLTDLAAVVPSLTRNVEANLAPLGLSKEDPEPDCQRHGYRSGSNTLKSADQVVIRVEALDWTELVPNRVLDPSPLVSTVASPPLTVGTHDLVLTSDTLYCPTPNSPRPLVEVITTLLARKPHARAVLAYALRIAYLDEIRECWRLLEEAGMTVIAEGRNRADTDIGDVQDWDEEADIEWAVWSWNLH